MVMLEEIEYDFDVDRVDVDHELLKKSRLETHELQLESVTGPRSEQENQSSVHGIISEASGSRTLESQYQEVETDIKDIHVAPIGGGSVSGIETEEYLVETSSVEDFGSTSSMNVRSHTHKESSIVPNKQEITEVEDMNVVIARCMEKFSVQRVIVNDQSPLLITKDDITSLESVYQRLSDTAKELLSHIALVYLGQEIRADTLVSSCITDGMVDSPEEAFSVLETLVNFKLLHVREDRQSFILLEVYRHILLDQVIPSKPNQNFLLRSGKGLTKPPDVEEWERSKEIHLMDNDLSELPEYLNCPKLQALFLQRNISLRVIPAAFFDNMPCLRVLNLSRTRIKTLPDSLFELINLKRLFVNHCDLLLMLPSRVGHLQSLEVLDLEGTEFMNLPDEIKKLTSLTSLKVSFCEPFKNGRSGEGHNKFPWRNIETLSQLKELHVDVSPSDERWNDDSADFVYGLSKLKLSAIKLYLPRDELLWHLGGRSTKDKFPPFKLFSITVGEQVERIIPRIPRDAELELEKYGKFLRYVNGKEFPDEVKYALENAAAFFLDRHTKITMLSDFGFENMVNLVCCVLGECNKLENIHAGTDTGDNIGFPSLEYLCIFYMKSLNGIWKGRLSDNGGFSHLKHLTIRTCLQLETVFTVELLSNTRNLAELTVDDCPAMKSVASCDSPGREEEKFLPSLKKISLHYLPELRNISGDLDILSRVEWMSIYNCPGLKSLPIEKCENRNLKQIKGESRWWESLQWEKNCWDDIFVSID